MSERHERQASGCIEVFVFLLLVSAGIFAMYALNYRLTKQDDWIRDLQRRVGELEQRK